jgi:hypothetical protein
MAKIIYYLKTVYLLIVLLFALAGCFRPNADETATPTLASTETATPAVTGPTSRPTNTPRPTQPPTATPSPTPEPIRPSIAVDEQALDEDGELTVSQVVAPAAGWLALHANEEGEPGVVLGYSEVEEGENEAVAVTIDPMQATETIHALLYLNEGGATAADADTFATLTAVAAESFAITIEVMLPSVVVSDQAVSFDGVVQVESVVSSGPGWLVLYADEGGEFGRPLAMTPLVEGLNEQVSLVMNWREATPELHVALYQDTGRPGRFDFPEADPPAVVRNSPVTSSFHVTLPPDIYVLDQPVVNGAVVIERVISNGPGWVVVQFDEEGQPGLIIGFAQLEDGLNERVVVPVREEAVTPTMFAYLHEDTGIIGEFEYPAADNPIRFEGRAPDLVPFNTQPGNYLTTQDQVFASDTITIPLVVADTNLWVVVYADNNGELAGIIGRSYVPAGVNRNVAVQIDSNRATNTVQAVLHIDAAEPEQFDYPNGDDLPLFRNRRLLAAPFDLIEE